MAFSNVTFIDRLESGRSWSLVYHTEVVQGLVEVWKLDNRFILTWEECPHGQQYDESEYTKDERHEFVSSYELLAFLDQSNLQIKLFRP